MRRVPVRSTTLRSIGYDKDARLLEAEFRSGRVYAYDAVPPELWLSFMATRSKGRFFNLLIRDRFRCREVGRKDARLPRPANT